MCVYVWVGVYMCGCICMCRYVWVGVYACGVHVCVFLHVWVYIYIYV